MAPLGRVVVVGAGLGGLRTVEALRRTGHIGSITLVGAERHLPYDRPPLTKQVLRGERDDTTLRADLTDLDLTLRLGRQAIGLDPDRRQVELDDGSSVGFDAAVLAPGASPRTLPGQPQRDGLHVVRTIDDALKLRSAIESVGSVCVIGAGFIGCEVAAAGRRLGAEVDLVEMLPGPLVRVLGPVGSALVTQLHESSGVRIHSGVTVVKVLGSERVEGVVLSDGTIIESSVVVVGLGVEPDVAWLEGSGIELDNGIRCTAGGRTSLPGVFAVGDAASWWHPLAGTHRRIEHWRSATDQAVVVATNIAVDNGSHEYAETELHEVPYFWSDQYDTKIQALGLVDPSDDVETITLGGRTILLYSREQRLRAVVGFGAAKWVMQLRRLIASEAPLAEAHALLT